VMHALLAVRSGVQNRLKTKCNAKNGFGAAGRAAKTYELVVERLKAALLRQPLVHAVVASPRE